MAIIVAKFATQWLFAFHDRVLFKSHQVIVPASLSPELLQKIHKAHQGADSSTQRCSQPMQSHAIPSRPWERVSADLFQLKGSNYLVLVDHYSDYIELESLRNTSAFAVIQAMKRNFAPQATECGLCCSQRIHKQCQESKTMLCRLTSKMNWKTEKAQKQIIGMAQHSLKLHPHTLNRSRKDNQLTLSWWEKRSINPTCN